MKKILTLCFIASLVCLGCKPAVEQTIPGISEDHPANKFYEFVSRNMATDDICHDYEGDPSIPMGEIAEGRGYVRSKDLVPGAFRFSDIKTGQKYLGVIYMQYQGILQLPKLCSWKEK